MSKLPFMPIDIDAYSRDTDHLSLEEHGAYLMLLFAMWRRGGSIPAIDDDIARKLGLDPGNYRRLKPRLMPYLEVYGPPEAQMLTQARLQKEWNRCQEVSARNSVKGKRGVHARAEKKKADDVIRSLSPGLSNGTIPSTSRGQALKKERIIPTTTYQKNTEGIPDLPPELDRRKSLLETETMKRVIETERRTA